MELCVTEKSPYARVVRVLIHELGLRDRVNITLVQTRKTDSPYYAINPSGRVPYLICDDGTALEESDYICEYLCSLEKSNLWDFPPGDDGWELRRLHGLCRSYLDGISVWLREIHRPTDEQSPTIIAHEKTRAERLSEVWETEITNPLMNGNLNRTQITLYCALDLERTLPDFEWREGHPNLIAWHEKMASQPSLQATQKFSQ